MTIQWIFLFAAGLCEICFALALKLSDGLTKFWPSVITIFFIGLSFTLLSFAMREIPIGTAYAVWTGIGASGTVILGMLFFNESTHILRLSALALILVGLIGLQAIE